MALLQAFTDAIQEFIKENAPLRSDKKNMDPMLRLESYVARTELNHLLTLVSQYKKEISAKSLQPFVELLDRRWRHIQKTDASYFHNEHSYINRLYIHLAQTLAKYLEVEPYALLMPGVEGLDPTRKLHEYICHGDPSTLMLVEEGFALLEKKYPAVQEPEFDDEPPTLQQKFEIDEEEQLLANHSVLARKYYGALKWKEGDRDQIKEEFLASLRSDDYVANDRKVSLYSNKHLIAGIIARTPRSKHDFVQLLKKLPVGQWKEFLSYVSDQDLFKFMLQANDSNTANLRKTMTIILNDKALKLESYHPKYERALGVAYAMVLKRMRILEGAWTSRLAQTFGPHMPKTGFFARACSYIVKPASDKRAKLDALDAYIDYLLDENNPIGGFDILLAQPRYAAIAAAFQGGISELLAGKNGFMNRLYADRRSAQAEGMVMERKDVKSGVKMSI